MRVVCTVNMDLIQELTDQRSTEQDHELDQTSSASL